MITTDTTYNHCPNCGWLHAARVHGNATYHSTATWVATLNGEVRAPRRPTPSPKLVAYEAVARSRALAISRRRCRAEAPRSADVHEPRAPRGGMTQVRSRQSYARVRCDRRRAVLRQERSQ